MSRNFSSPIVFLFAMTAFNLPWTSDASAQVKIGGTPPAPASWNPPDNSIPDTDPSVATVPVPEPKTEIKNCKWQIKTATQRGTSPGRAPECVFFFYKTTVTLEVTSCEGQAVPKPKKTSRQTMTGPHCGKAADPTANPPTGPMPPEPKSNATYSSGPDQAGVDRTIFVQPDGTTVTMPGTAGATATVVYPDTTTVSLR